MPPQHGDRLSRGDTGGRALTCGFHSARRSRADGPQSAAVRVICCGRVHPGEPELLPGERPRSRRGAPCPDERCISSSESLPTGAPGRPGGAGWEGLGEGETGGRAWGTGHPWLCCPGEAKARAGAGRLQKALRGPGAHLDSRSPSLIAPSCFSLSSPCVCDDVHSCAPQRTVPQPRLSRQACLPVSPSAGPAGSAAHSPCSLLHPLSGP